MTAHRCRHCGAAVPHPSDRWCSPACRAALLERTRLLIRVYCRLAKDRAERVAAERASKAA